jgi:hypothetical protein
LSKVSIINNIFSHLNNKKPFRFSKNGVPTNIFTKVNAAPEIKSDFAFKNDESSTFKNSIKIKMKKGKGKAKAEENQNFIEEEQK